MLIEIPSFEQELDVAFDVLDAAIHRCISKMVDGFVEFIREEPTKATVIYNLSQYQIGEFGKIRIDKLGTEKSLISLFEVRKPFSDRVKHYYDFVAALFNKLDQENIFIDLQTNQKQNINNVTKVYVGGDVHADTFIAGNENQASISNSDKKPKQKKP